VIGADGGAGSSPLSSRTQSRDAQPAVVPFDETRAARSRRLCRRRTAAAPGFRDLGQRGVAAEARGCRRAARRHTHLRGAAGDLVRFHTVLRPWRQARPSPPRTSPGSSFLRASS